MDGENEMGGGQGTGRLRAERVGEGLGIKGSRTPSRSEKLGEEREEREEKEETSLCVINWRL